MATNVAENMVFRQFQVCKEIYTSGMLQKLNLTPVSKLVLIALANHYNPEKPDMYPSQKYLGQQLGVSEKSVNRAIQELVNAKIVSYDNSGKVNRYKFTDIFFMTVKMSVNKGQNVCRDADKMSDKHIKENKKNKGNVLNFSKREPVSYSQQEGVVYPSPEASRKAIEASLVVDDKTPMNDKETALRFIESLKGMESNPLVREKIEKVKRIHQIDDKTFVVLTDKMSVFQDSYQRQF